MKVWATKTATKQIAKVIQAVQPWQCTCTLNKKRRGRGKKTPTMDRNQVQQR